MSLSYRCQKKGKRSARLIVGGIFLALSRAFASSLSSTRRDTKFYEETSPLTGPVAEGVALPDVVARLTRDKDTRASHAHIHTFRACLLCYVRALILNASTLTTVHSEWKMNARRGVARGARHGTPADRIRNSEMRITSEPPISTCLSLYLSTFLFYSYP